MREGDRREAIDRLSFIKRRAKFIVNLIIAGFESAFEGAGAERIVCGISVFGGLQEENPHPVKRKIEKYAITIAMENKKPTVRWAERLDRNEKKRRNQAERPSLHFRRALRMSCHKFFIYMEYGVIQCFRQ